MRHKYASLKALIIEYFLTPGPYQRRALNLPLNHTPTNFIKKFMLKKRLDEAHNVIVENSSLYLMSLLLILILFPLVN